MKIERWFLFCGQTAWYTLRDLNKIACARQTQGVDPDWQ